MSHDGGRAYRPLAGAVEVAIAAGQLPPSARGWGKTVLLEELAPVLGQARNTLRNLYYRQDPRLVPLLETYVATSHSHVIAGLEELGFHSLSPLVWKRGAEQLRASRQGLEGTVILLQAAERTLRESPAPPIGLRRMVGAAAAEVMACALTFFEGEQRWDLLLEGERIFISAMAPLTLECDIEPADAALFARFWENRATRCGLEWSNVWDDPSLPPPIGMDVVRRAIAELDEAAVWMRRHGGRPAPDDERLRQLLADKAKWLARPASSARRGSNWTSSPTSMGPAPRPTACWSGPWSKSPVTSWKRPHAPAGNWPSWRATVPTKAPSPR
jgi:hypothetical protein